MSKTNHLRRAVKTLLSDIGCAVYYRNGLATATFPYIVFRLENWDLSDLWRNDVVMTLTLWDKGKSYGTIEALADKVEGVFHNKNYPTNDILPTFYLLSRQVVEDENKEIKRIDIKVQIQNYERNETA